MGVRVVFPDMGKDPSIQLIEKTITENGTYDAITDGANGYSKVNVNVEGGGGSSDFSTAEVTYRLTFNEFEEALTNAQVLSPISVVNNELGVPASVPVEDISQGSTSVDIKCFTPLYKNKITVDVSRVNLHNEYVRYVYAGAPITATGNATITNNSLANITGDCVITIPVELRH